ncbi:MAG: PhoH family protein [Planctomycetes bacterium]|nr:PhoH family protein [Planctomycetota bacterium]|tara:strand:- start:7554 stop:9047 length:1494 start_codon:yes stop_codon:yes gene_type:complete
MTEAKKVPSVNDLPRQYLLDTNVLISDPSAIYQFQEHDIVIPMILLEELDAIKDGRSSKDDMVKSEVRQAIRNLSAIVGDHTPEEIYAGIQIAEGAGKLRILNDAEMLKDYDLQMMGDVADNSFIRLTHLLQTNESDRRTIFVTKDFNAKIKAKSAGVREVEEYLNEQQLSDIEFMASGFLEITPPLTSILEGNEDGMDVRQGRGGVTMYTFPLACLKDLVEDIYLNLYIFSEQEENVWRVANIDARPGEPELVTLHCKPLSMMMKVDAFGIKPRSVPQAIAFDALLDPAIDMVQLTGPAGSGKTLLALAAALHQSRAGDSKTKYNKILVTRNLPDMTEAIGFLPGTEEEKMAPWLAAFADSLEVLADVDTRGHTDDKPGDHEAMMDSIKYITSKANLQYKSANFMRGRSIQNAIVILDESQNLTPHQIRSIITRSGMGTKMIILGNVGQIDARYVTALTSGLTHAVERMKGYQGGAVVSLPGGERSPLSSFAESNL